MRKSFLKSKTVPKLRKTEIEVETKLEPDNLNKTLSQGITGTKQEQVKKQRSCRSMMSVSFNLDKMYFDSESDTGLPGRSKAGSLKEEEGLQLVQVIGLTKVDVGESPLTLSGVKIPLKSNEKDQQLDSIKSEKNGSIKSKGHCPTKDQQQSSSTKQSIKLEFIETEEELDWTISLEKSNSNQEKVHDFEVQVSFSSSSQSQIQSFDQLSDLDKLILYPENYSIYNNQKLLFVTIEEIAKLYALPIEISDFVHLNPFQAQKQQHQRIFQAVMIDWKDTHHKENSKRIFSLAQIRTLVIRDAMNCLVDQIIHHKEQQDYHIRISKTYRIRYQQAGIPIPPPRVNNSYLETLFFNPQIKQFYINYLNEKKLQAFLKEDNIRRIELFTLELIQCLELGRNNSVEELVQIFKKKKKPFTFKQIQMILQEARNIANDYGHAKKRIGNGVDKTQNQITQKASQKKENSSITLKEEIPFQLKVQANIIETKTRKFDRIKEKCKEKLNQSKLQGLEEVQINIKTKKRIKTK